jgi:HTH-like domain
MAGVSERRVCRVLAVSRSAMRIEENGTKRKPIVDEVLTARIERLIHEHPTFGYRRLWALLRFREGVRINRKAVYRALRVKGWFALNSDLRPTRAGSTRTIGLSVTTTVFEFGRPAATHQACTMETFLL